MLKWQLDQSFNELFYPKAANQSKYGCTTGEGEMKKVVVVNQGDGKMVVVNQL